MIPKTVSTVLSVFALSPSIDIVMVSSDLTVALLLPEEIVSQVPQGHTFFPLPLPPE